MKTGQSGCSGILIMSAAGCIILFPGCFLLSPEIPVEVLIPVCSWGEEGLKMSYTLVYPDGGGSLRRKHLESGKTRALIRLPREGCVPVTAYPLGRLKPSGAFLDRDSGRDAWSCTRRLELKEEDGALAEIMLSLWRMKERCDLVSLETLQAALLEEGEGDPWSCDSEMIRHAILTGELNYLRIRKLQGLSIEAVLPEADWISETKCWAGEVAVLGCQDEQYTLLFEDLYPGCARFYSPGAGLELHLFPEKNGACRYIIARPSAFAVRY